MKPSPTLIDQRARHMVEAMERAQHWIYAVPPEAAEGVVNILKSKDLVRVEDPDEGFAFTTEDATISGVVDEDLGVCWLVAVGEAAVPAMAEVLKVTGFFAHTELFHTAHDAEDPGALDAALTLVRMAMEWDEHWTTLVRGHWDKANEEDRSRILEALAALAERVRSDEVSVLRDGLRAG